jgi:hypothetical protein
MVDVIFFASGVFGNACHQVILHILNERSIACPSGPNCETGAFFEKSSAVDPSSKLGTSIPHDQCRRKFRQKILTLVSICRASRWKNQCPVQSAALAIANSIDDWPLNRR